ncbi:MAG: 3-oxoacyl-ACP synthase [Alphaproteobacteria bacterium]|nr:3-oxoacyl-ACP synthase [Alphaproteobacteria bacterium]MCB9794490.1 3-oxoacyl-ACP synthase [Alphaproteobacteria bacterium]
MRLPCRILGTGSHLPGPPVDNAQVAAASGGRFAPEWVQQWTGIEARHHAGEGDSVASLATAAARQALAAAQVEPGALSRLILATSTGGDRPGPATAAMVQHALGARCAAFDLGSGCHGFLTGLDLAARLVDEGPVLLIAAELLSRHYLDRRDRRTWPLFGDGAAAVVLGAARGQGGLLASVHEGHGEHARSLFVPGPDDPEFAEGQHIRFDAHGRRFREVVGALVPAGVARALAQAGLEPEQIEHVVPHQPNALWTVDLCRGMGLDPARVPVVVDRTGNVPAAMVPLGLDALWRGPRPPRSGEHVLSFSVGAGLGLGVTVLRVD